MPAGMGRRGGEEGGEQCISGEEGGEQCSSGEEGEGAL